MSVNKLGLITYLTIHGKTKSGKSWEDLAKQFGFKSGESARQHWKDYRSKTGKKPSTVAKGLIFPVKTEKGDYVASEYPYPFTPDECFKAPEIQLKSFSENVEKQEAEAEYIIDTEIKSLEDLIAKTNIDTNKWQITRYVQNYWGNSKDPRWQVKAWLALKPKENIFKEEFLKFLKGYKPQEKIKRNHKETTNRWGCIIINKQDAHLNKYDIKGSNSIQGRFSKIERYVENVLDETEKLADIDKIIYVLGSDQFNSEWHSATTKGTPQKNILGYHEAFEVICQHETTIINFLLESCNELEIIYIPGNHDEYVGWHMVNWLKAFYRNQANMKINDNPSYTKYIRYHSNALAFNHGDGAKPQKLAANFPIQFKDFSDCDYHYLFTGDKHFEQSNDFNGIKHYQLPVLSNSHSNWDEKQGYLTTKGELTTFLLDRQYGLRHVFKQPI